MKRTLRPEEARLWALIAATVRPSPGRKPPPFPPPAPPLKAGAPAANSSAASATPQPARPRPAAHPAPWTIEPGRKRRIARGRDPLEARLDLHGLDQDRARERLTAFLLDAHAAGARSVLVITGKGVASQGVLRRRAPEWLSDPRLREVIAGVAPADRRHGGDGAIYVALKRRAP